MLLAEDHLPFRAMQRLPQPDPALQGAAQIVGKTRVTALHLAPAR